MLLSSVVAVALSAQTVDEAVRYTQNNYYGTARTVALGNAVTALGGDIGTVEINPAGSAVANYSQFSITPNLSFSLGIADYYPVRGGQLNNSNSASKAGFMVPNVGITYKVDLGVSRGLKSVTFGFISNVNNNFLNNVDAYGINGHTSFMAAMAGTATSEGYPTETLSNFDTYYESSSHAPSWGSILAYRSNLIGCIDDIYNYYIGSTENAYASDSYYVELGGDLRQAFKEQEIGSKRDLLFNLGFNISDELYLGANLGMPVINYSSVDYLQEDALNSDDFHTTLIKGNYSYTYNASLTGVYGKFGFIYRPVSGLRIGGAIQTPTLYNIRETWCLDGASYYNESAYNASDSSPKAEYSYFIRTPFFYNLGIAYTIGNFALISVDWERTDYGSTRFRSSRSSISESSFQYTNDDIRKTCGAVNEFRVGAEVKPLSDFSIRAGYNQKSGVMAFSAGLGYSSPGSFYVDFATKWTRFEDIQYSPYADYIETDNGSLYPSASVVASRSLLDFMLSFGWRF